MKSQLCLTEGAVGAYLFRHRRKKGLRRSFLFCNDKFISTQTQIKCQEFDYKMTRIPQFAITTLKKKKASF